jgi:putative aldouronate transport system permease protein
VVLVFVKQQKKDSVLQMKKVSLWKKIWKYRVLTLMCLPAIIFFFAFSYMPLPGIYVAFVKYNYRDGIFGSNFVGLQNFEFLVESGKLFTLTRNTILYNLAFIILGNLFAVTVAILLNEMQSHLFKKVSQTMMFLPYFISQVLVGILVFNLLNYDTGFVNGILTSLGMEKWQPYADPGSWPPLLVIIFLWQQTGYNSVIYFAAIMGIDSETIEAAKVDGANGFQKIRFIILPSLRPTIVILLLFALGGIVKGNFGLFYNIIGTNSLLYGTTDIIETFVYRATMTDFNFSTASAVGLYQSIVGFVIVMTANYIVRKIEPDYALF